MNKYKIASIAVSAVVAISVLFGIIQITHQSKNAQEKAISQEFVLCLSAVCLEAGPGYKCNELRAVITQIVVTEDINVPGAQRIIVRPSGKQCGTSNFQ